MTSCQGRNPLVKGHLWASNISPNIISYRADIIVELTDWYNDSKVLVLAQLYFQRLRIKTLFSEGIFEGMEYSFETM